MNLWTRFWKWYEPHVLLSLYPGVIILWLQVPHTITAADCFFTLGWEIVHHDPISNFLLYGIDLLEAIPLTGMTLAVYVDIKKRLKKRSEN